VVGPGTSGTGGCHWSYLVHWTLPLNILTKKEKYEIMVVIERLKWNQRLNYVSDPLDLWSVIMIVWSLDLQLPMQSVPITTNIVSSNPTLYSIQHYVIKLVSDLWQVDGFLRVLRFPPPIKRPPWYNWNIVESGVKHHNLNLNPWTH
jgi:hypothetical protein